MEIIVVLIIIGLIFYFLSRSGVSSDYEEEDYDDDEEIEVAKDKIQEVAYPFFYALQNKKEVYNNISSDFQDLAKLLSSQKNENIQSGIDTLISQDKFRENKNLPKYLQTIPIKSFLSNGIFISPSKSDLPDVLSSMKMVELKKYCSELGIKSGKSKDETIKLLCDTNIDEKIDFDNYFKLNPKVKELYNQVGEYCQTINEKLLDNQEFKVEQLNSSSRLVKDELGDKEEKQNYKLQDYTNSVIYFKDNIPLYKINYEKYGIFGHTFRLLRNGNILHAIQSRIGEWEMTNIIIIDENLQTTQDYTIKNTGWSSEITELDNKPVIFINIKDNRIWTLNYKEMKEKYLENPDNIDVYSLMESSTI